jgi:hypothetical protein
MLHGSLAQKLSFVPLASATRFWTELLAPGVRDEQWHLGAAEHLVSDASEEEP